jgi:hypothetical protein
MVNTVFPTHFIINVNSQEFSIRPGCNLLVIIYNAYFVLQVIVSSCKLNVVNVVHGSFSHASDTSVLLFVPASLQL